MSSPTSHMKNTKQDGLPFLRRRVWRREHRVLLTNTHSRTSSGTKGAKTDRVGKCNAWHEDGLFPLFLPRRSSHLLLTVTWTNAPAETRRQKKISNCGLGPPFPCSGGGEEERPPQKGPAGAGGRGRGRETEAADALVGNAGRGWRCRLLHRAARIGESHGQRFLQRGNWVKVGEIL